VVGVEDGGFSKKILDHGISRALFVSVLFVGRRLYDFQLDEITVDGLDATEKLSMMLRRWSFDTVILAGVSFAGFNLVDSASISKEFKKPVIIVARTKPNNVGVKNALRQHFKDWRIRWSIFEKLGPVYEVVSMVNEPPIYVEVVGTRLDWAERVLRSLATCCRIPEPIRVARLIARGLTGKAT
jgi:hypothetical protein